MFSARTVSLRLSVKKFHLCAASGRGRRELLQTFDLSVGVDPLIRKLGNQDGEVRFDEFADFLSKQDHELDTVLHRKGNRSICFLVSCIPRRAALRKQGCNNAATETSCADGSGTTTITCKSSEKGDQT